MKSTACGAECPFVKQGFCQSHKECPHYIETWWYPPEEGSPPEKLEDCSPKRMILQQQVLQAKFDLTSQALIDSRNEYHQLSNHLKKLIEMAQNVIISDESKKIKEIKNENEEIFIPHNGVLLSN